MSLDTIFRLVGKKLISIKTRSFREGLHGETLEAALQGLIERHPQLLLGTRNRDVQEECGLVLLRREMPLQQWSLDHLLVDRNAILTLVETKLFENPESRREVIGQIIEYAAHAKTAWANGVVRERAAEYWDGMDGKSVDEILCEEFDLDESSIDGFWVDIEENLAQGRIRLVIAGDQLRPEVRQSIEYLNGEMRNAEVLGFELKGYGDEEDLIIIPTVIGQLHGSSGPPSDRHTWTPTRLRQAFDQIDDSSVSRRLLQLLGWAEQAGCFLESASKGPCFGLASTNDKRLLSISPTWIYLYFEPERYAEGSTERDQLVTNLKAANLLPSALDPSTVQSGRNLSRSPSELTDDQLEDLLKILERHCQNSLPE